MNILIFARHFPPFVSGGARRPYLLANGLENLGHNVCVIAPALPEDITGVSVIHPAPVAEASASAEQDGPPRPGTTTALKNWIRANLFLPDPDIRWAMRAAKAAKQLTDFVPDWVVSTSPPESVHIAALSTARRYRCRWAADFRDHWLIYPLIREREAMARRVIERRIAKSLLSRADLLFSPEQSMLEEVASYAPKTPTLHLPQAAFVSSPTHPRSDGPNRPITIVHTGSFSLSHSKRSIDPALSLITEARRRDARFQLVLIGRLTAEEAAKARAVDGVELLGEVELEEAWQAQTSADILLNVAAPDAKTPPGKLAEYKAAQRPIVFIGGDQRYRTKHGGDTPPIEQLMQAVATPNKSKSAKFPSPEATAEKLLNAMRDIETSDR
ncbi:MAG: glycosyltransferase [Pseudomonadota bacterium]